MNQEHRLLFSPYKLRNLELNNRIVMAPMTRCRATGNIPNELMAQYYSQRAGAGLIITEGTSPSPNGLGYARIPGMYSQQQIKGWKIVTDAVHAKGGKIFIQLMHTGRVAHQLNLPENARVVAPSAIPSGGQMWTDSQGMQPQTTPVEIATQEMPALIAEYVNSARAAIEAGFDGVEIHSANGYLPMQFLSASSNQRSDNYGGTPENRNRFVLEVAGAMAEAIGKDKVGIRLSPFNPFNGITPGEQEADQYLALAEGLKKTGIAYIHLLTFAMPQELIGEMHQAFDGTFILNGGYTAGRAEADLETGKCELVSIGRPYLANPDLVERMKTGAVLAEASEATYYSAGEQGYTDYQAL